MKSLKRSSKAQLLEYLTTYGWAILLVFVILISFSYLNILNPSRNLPSRCIIGPEFQCIDFRISGSGDTFSLLLKNNLPERIVLTNIKLRNDNFYYPCSLESPNAFPIMIPSGNLIDLKWDECNFEEIGLTVGEKEKIIFDLDFYLLGSTPNFGHIAIGEAYGTVV